MSNLIMPVMILVLAMSVFGSREAPAELLDLSVFQWKNRLLILFAPNRSHPLFAALHQSLAVRQAEAAERDLVIFEILESAVSSMNNEVIHPATARRLREKFDVPAHEFTVILIGKDGGIKLERREQTQLNDIFALIDSMPMRQEEMRQ